MTDPNLIPEAPAARPAVAFAGLLLLVLVFLVGLVVGQSGFLAQAPASIVSGTPAPTDLALVQQAYDLIQENYVGRSDLSSTTLVYGAIRGMVEALGDTGHSVFLTPEALQAAQDSLGGSIVGIGVVLGQRDDQVVVVSVVSGGPAEEAGIRSGDRIVAVDGESVEGLATDEVAGMIRGEEGTTVNIELERPSTDEQLSFDLVREEIDVPAVSWSMVPGTNIAVLRLIQFSSGAGEELRAARDEAVAAGAEAFILDLRSNPGGFVDEAANVASLFLDDDVVYIRELADGERIPVETKDDLTASDLPVVVLIDEGTASSAEIVSGAIKAAGRGELIGETTFGTGTVLLDFGLEDGSAMRLAVERWLTPDGELIFGRGIEPTIEVPLAPDQVAHEPDDFRNVDPAAVPLLEDDQLQLALELLTGGV